jgi:glycosyltransferase involved in cell wall biosynthesis
MLVSQAMKILMINYEFPPIGGGAGQAHARLLKEYGEIKGLSVDVLTSGIKHGVSHEPLLENIHIYRVGIKKKSLHFWQKSEVLMWLYKSRKVYQEMIKKNNYDLVHTFFAFPSGWLCYRSRNTLPYIVSLRGSDVPGYNERLGLDYKILSRLFRRIWRNAGVVVANSEGLKGLAQKFVNEIDYQVIPNGIDTDLFYPGEQLVKKRIRLLSVSRLIARKRIDMIIASVQALKTNGYDVHLTIAGEGDLSLSLMRQVNALNLEDNVTFLGIVAPEKVSALYRDHDLFLMASIHEGMSNAMLEAMASGLPVITTQCEGVEELISNNGIVLEASTKNEMAAAISKLINAPEQIKAMQLAARKQAKLFSWASSAKKYVALYQQVCEKSRRCN